jgi:hypothetical protein
MSTAVIGYVSLTSCWSCVGLDGKAHIRVTKLGIENTPDSREQAGARKPGSRTCTVLKAACPTVCALRSEDSIYLRAVTALQKLAYPMDRGDLKISCCSVTLN